jgi:hypothetical protein
MLFGLSEWKTKTIRNTASALWPCQAFGYLDAFTSIPSPQCCAISFLNIPFGTKSGWPLWYRFFAMVAQYFGTAAVQNSPTTEEKLAGMHIDSSRGRSWADRLEFTTVRNFVKSFIADSTCAGVTPYGSFAFWLRYCASG